MERSHSRAGTWTAKPCQLERCSTWRGRSRRARRRFAKLREDATSCALFWDCPFLWLAAQMVRPMRRRHLREAAAGRGVELGGSPAVRHGIRWQWSDPTISADGPAVYPEWQLARPAIPSRSRLYCLEPIGIGTPETESLTSYVSRLAEAHSVSVHDLVVHELLPFLGRPHLANGRNANLLTAFWRNETRALNGTRSLARKMVRGLESLTGRDDLRFLTLLTWTEVLPVHLLQKSTRAWCPGCFEDWRESGRVIYDPLVWTLAPVTVCPHHRRPLRTICPFPECRRRSPWLGSRSRPGCCARCGGWLGNSRTHGGTEEEMLVMEEAVRTRAWIFHAIGELIGAAPTLTRYPRREHLVRTIEAAFR